MNTLRSVLITGAAGGIGTALCDAYSAEGWRVLATDHHGSIMPRSADAFIPADLEEIATDDDVRTAFRNDVSAASGDASLTALINNAASQILGNVSVITLADWERTLRVNVTAPFRLAQVFLDDLRIADGTIINIGSVHAQATKQEFVAYAMSKAAIHGMTRAMAVDLGGNPRVICVAPAAVSTPMLEEGFKENPQALDMLSAAHPIGRIATPVEIAQAIVAMSQHPFHFATGTTIWLDGGILSRLHDPI
ncbi:MAG: SDR family oxidoreductase [Sphingobium sp.]|nr:SDR family oxidoreductase [Sphingobium sp.]MCP5398806.1 SDR family oxidoreductase [Sphingomonas sp.]